MFGIFTEEEIRKMFLELADEMEKECGDWESLPETDADRALKERIVTTIKEKYPEDFV